MALIQLDLTPVKVICSIEDCEDPFYGSLLCKRHYMQQYRRKNGQNPGRYKVQPDDVDGLWLRIQDHLGAFGPNGRRIPI